MEPLREPAQLFERSRELVFGMDDPFTRLCTRDRQSAAAQGLGQLLESMLSTLTEATLQPHAFFVACIENPSTRGGELHDPSMHLGLEPSVGGGELGGGRHRFQEPGSSSTAGS